MAAWIENEPIHDCPACRYPYQGERCPNPGCDINLSDATKAANAERKRLDDEWTANFRRFYHTKRRA
jgi:hypothetical protein